MRHLGLGLAIGSALTVLAGAGAVEAQAARATDLAAQYREYMSRPRVVRPGLGEDQSLPVGLPVQFPEGVELSGPIVGVDEGEACGEGPRGSGYNVIACMTLCNRSGRPQTVRLPRGMTLVSKSASRYQNGMLIEDIAVVVPPSTCGGGGIPLDKDRDALDREGVPPPGPGTRIRLALYCLNESMSPSEGGLPYALGPVTGDEALQELLELIAGRELDEDAAEVVQTAIYSITENRGLSPADRSALAGL